MIALFDGDELVFPGSSARIPIVADEADRAVDGIRAAEREINVVEVSWRAIGEFRGQPDCRLRAEAEIGGCIRKLPHLLCRRLDDAVMTVASIDAPKAGKAIDQLFAVRIGDCCTASRCQDPHAQIFVAAIGSDRMDQMRAVEFDQGIAKHEGLRISRAPDWRGQRWPQHDLLRGGSAAWPWQCRRRRARGLVRRARAKDCCRRWCRP